MMTRTNYVEELAGVDGLLDIAYSCLPRLEEGSFLGWMCEVQMIGVHKVSKSVENDILRLVGKETCMWTIVSIRIDTPYPIHIRASIMSIRPDLERAVRDRFPGCHRHSNRTSFGQTAKAQLVVSGWSLTLYGVARGEAKTA